MHWIQDGAEWTVGEVTSADGSYMNVKVRGISKKLDKNKLCKAKDSTLEGKTDLIELEEFWEAPLVHTLKTRFYNQEFLTTAGNVCLTMNDSFQEIPGLDHRAIILMGAAYKNQIAKTLLNSFANGQLVEKAFVLLEAFGNAKTLQNENCSRVGFCFDIYYEKTVSTTIVVKSTPIERSRVYSHILGESNFHILYQVSSGEFFNYLTEEPGLCGNFEQTKTCMEILGFDRKEILKIKNILIGILHIGNIEIVGDLYPEIVNYEELEKAAEFLSVSPQVLSKGFLYKDEDMPLDPQESVCARDNLAASIYAQVYEFVLKKINEALFKGFSEENWKITLVDLCGFEEIDANSFDQFVRNYSNEKLRNFFLKSSILNEQQEYLEEELKWDQVKIDGKEELVELIEKGIFKLIDSYTETNQEDSEMLLEISNTFADSKDLLDSAGYADECFGLSHFAGDVYYNGNGFLKKNKEFHGDLIGEILGEFYSAHSMSLLRDLESKLNEIFSTLANTEPYFVLCLNPNLKSGRDFDWKHVWSQLKAYNISECIEFKKRRYGDKEDVQAFIREFWQLEPSVLSSKLGTIGKCKQILNTINVEGIELGNAHVYMKTGIKPILVKLIDEKKTYSALLIQKHVKGFLFRNKYVNNRNSAIKLQRFIKAKIFNRNFSRATSAKTVIKRGLTRWVNKRRSIKQNSVCNDNSEEIKYLNTKLELLNLRIAQEVEAKQEIMRGKELAEQKLKSLSEELEAKQSDKQLEKENALLRQTLAKNKQELQTTTAKKNKVMQDFLHLQKEMKNFKQKTSGEEEYEEIINQQREEIDHLYEEIESLRNSTPAVQPEPPQDDTKDEEIAILKEEILRMREDNRKLSQKLNEYENQLNQLQGSSVVRLTEEYNNKINEQNQEIMTLEEEISNSKQVYSTLVKLLKCKNNEIDSYKNLVLYPGNSIYESQIENFRKVEYGLLEQLDEQMKLLDGADSDEEDDD